MLSMLSSMRTKSMRPGILTLAGLLSAAGCGASLAGFCANEDVASGLELRLVDREGVDDRLRAGAYHFRVTTELGKLEWSCEIVKGDALGSGCAADHVISANSGDTQLLVSSVASEEKFWIDLKLIEPGEWSGPAEVHIEISRDDVVVADEMYTPRYTLSPASGAEGCPDYYMAEDEPPTLEL